MSRNMTSVRAVAGSNAWQRSVCPSAVTRACPPAGIATPFSGTTHDSRVQYHGPLRSRPTTMVPSALQSSPHDC